MRAPGPAPRPCLRTSPGPDPWNPDPDPWSHPWSPPVGPDLNQVRAAATAKQGTKPFKLNPPKKGYGCSTPGLLFGPGPRRRTLPLTLTLTPTPTLTLNLTLTLTLTRNLTLTLLLP